MNMKQSLNLSDGQHNTETQEHNTEKLTDQKIGLTTRLSTLTFTDNDANIGLRLQSKQGEVAKLAVRTSRHSPILK